MTATTTNEAENAALADLELALSDFDLDDLEEIVEDAQEIVEDDDDTIQELVASDEDTALGDDELDEDTLSAMEMELEKQEAYSAQAGTGTVVSTIQAPTPISSSQAAAKTKTTRVSKPRIQRDLNDVDAEFFVLTGDVAAMDKAEIDAAKIATIHAKPSQVKIAEKFENLFVSIASGRLPSHYTMAAFNLLDTHKTLTSAELIAGYKTTLAKCGEGTARSQTGQLMVLLHVSGIATRSGNTLTLRTDSVVADRLRAIIAAQTA